MQPSPSLVHRYIVSGLLCLLLSVAAVAQPHHVGPAADAGEKAAPNGATPFMENQSVTHHSMTLDGEKISYTATAGTLLLKDDMEIVKGEEGKAKASVFYIAYTRDGVEDPAARPVTFSFNGGPGSAALWVNIGAFGPKKVAADEEGFPLPPPGKLIENRHSILDVSDLVFIDPVGTGLSRKAEDASGEEFWGTDADIESVGEFIRLWTTRNERWTSPKFLAGESYGTSRSAGLADHLAERHGMYLNGIVMISTVLNWQNQEFTIGNDLAYVIHLPTYAATAWHHGRLPAAQQQKALPDFLAEVEEFARGDYALALLQGDALPAAERRAMAERLSGYTGLSPDYLERTRLRILLWRFMTELLRDEGKVVGRLDSRFTGYNRDAASEFPEYDPSMTAVSIGYVTLMNDYVRRELDYETDLPYRSLSREVRPWKRLRENQNMGWPNLAEDLRQAMVKNPSLRVFFAAGYFDFATPYYDTHFTVDHLGLPEERRGNIEIEHYEAGHMMYIRETDHAKLKRDVADFIRRTTPGK